MTVNECDKGKERKKEMEQKVEYIREEHKKNTKTNPSARSNRKVSNKRNVIFNKNKIYTQVCSSKEFCK
jgi:hypothetical protein